MHLIILFKTDHNLNEEKVSEYKEVFKLIDKDEDGVLSFHELSGVMKLLGQRPSVVFQRITCTSKGNPTIPPKKL